MNANLMSFKSIGVRALTEQDTVLRTLIVGAIAVRDGMVHALCFGPPPEQPQRHFATDRAKALGLGERRS